MKENFIIPQNWDKPGREIVDLVLLRNLPEEQYDILKAYSLNFFNDNKDKTL